MPENVPCRWCGMEMPADAEKCPWCYRAVPAPASRAAPPEPEDTPPQRALSREEFGTFAALPRLARHDPLMFAVIAAMILASVVWLISRDLIAFIVMSLLLWAILRWRRWAFWLIVIVEGLTILLLTTLLIAAATFTPEIRSPMFTSVVGISLAIALFVFFAVIAGRDRFV